MPASRRIDSEKNLKCIRKKLLHRMPQSGDYPTGIEGFVLHRFNGETDPKPYFYKPVVIVVIQGKKRVRLGERDIIYGDRSCFITGVSMPVASCVLEATEDEPYLSMSLNLDRVLIANLAARIPPSSKHGAQAVTGAVIQDLSPELTDAFLRLLEQTETSDRIGFLGSLICQEIHFRLLTGPFGNQLRMLHTYGTHGGHIAEAISWLRENYARPLHIEELAARLNMATSTFHKHFKDITTVSPLQYQKRLRLTEAQRLMLSEGYDAAQAAFAVGYESTTQFSREYKRLFGEAPRRDVIRMMTAPEGRRAAALA